MSWIAPVALLGALTVVLPILIHMMGRGRTIVVRFPSLRFLEASRLLPARRTRIHDLPLLLLRAGALIAAAVALAQPLFRPEAASPAADLGVARVVVLDTSASMQRLTPAGGSAAVASQRIADSLAGDAARGGRVVRAADLRRAIAGAGAWAATQSGRVEIAVVSDFQLNAMDGATIQAVDTALGLQFVRVPVAPSSAPSSAAILSRSRQSGAKVSARIAFVGDRTDVEWTVNPQKAIASQIELRSALGSQAGASATRHAAEVIGVAESTDTSRVGVAVAFGTAPPNGPGKSDARLATRRQAGIVARLLSDPLLAPEPGEGVDQIIDGIASPSEAGKPVLTIMSSAKVGTPQAVNLLAALERSVPVAAPASELDPAVISDATINSWRRVAGDRPAVAERNPSDPASFDGRWFWILVLTFLTGELLLRRSPTYARAPIANDAG